MGYSHYTKTDPLLHPETFAKISIDFQKMVEPLKRLGVEIADGLGENTPIITTNEITFNGVSNSKFGEPCSEQEYEVSWQNKNKSDEVGQKLQEIVDSEWFAKANLMTRLSRGDPSHETFSLVQESNLQKMYGDETEETMIFGCTKTARKPYDLAVNVCLIIAKHYLKDSIQVTSDGSKSEWREGMKLCQKFLGYGADFALDEDPIKVGDLVKIDEDVCPDCEDEDLIYDEDMCTCTNRHRFIRANIEWDVERTVWMRLEDVSGSFVEILDQVDEADDIGENLE